jgi:hypothetical protein
VDGEVYGEVVHRYLVDRTATRIRYRSADLHVGDVVRLARTEVTLRVDGWATRGGARTGRSGRPH